MSITQSLSNAISGLTANSRAAQLVSNNIANALTEGYGRREIALSSREVDGVGAGVQIDGVVRVVDNGLIRDRRLADAALGFADDAAAFLKQVTKLVGTPDQEQSISGRFRLFESSLITAASRPDSETRLSGVLATAQELVEALNDASDGVQEARLDADRAIALQIDQLNSGLRQIQEINGSIASLNGRGRDVSGLEDERQSLIDALSTIVPLREVPRDDGKVALYTDGGAILLEDTPATIEFSAATFVTASTTIGGGTLSGVTIDGLPIATSGSTFLPLGGGTLGAAFAVRDELGPDAQVSLDALARDLVERFEDPALDATTLAGDPGLFTDAGTAFAAANEVGLSARLEVNAIVDPTQGGELRRLRDGLGAAVAGDIGNADQLSAFADALSDRRPQASGPQAGITHTSHTLASALVSQVSGDLVVLERRASYAAAEQQSLKELELASGVDTDQELQKLLLIEQAYAANARVIQTIDSLIQDLLAI